MSHNSTERIGLANPNTPEQEAKVTALVTRRARSDADRDLILTRLGIAKPKPLTVVKVAKPIEKQTRELLPCGTPAAYMRHLTAHEEPCTPCRAAEAKRQRLRRAKYPAA